MTDETRYVLLNAGDVIQGGDEYWLVDKPNWLPSGYVGSKVPPGFLYRRADLSSPLGVVAMRDAAIAEIDCGGCYGSCVDPANCRIEDVAAIRDLPLPTHAALLAAALKLPEVAAMRSDLVSMLAIWDKTYFGGGGRHQRDGDIEALSRKMRTTLAASEARHE